MGHQLNKHFKLQMGKLMNEDFKGRGRVVEKSAIASAKSEAAPLDVANQRKHWEDGKH
jgi:hypothetical protein